MKNENTDNYQNEIEEILLLDIKLAVKYAPILLLIAILAESCRKYTLHLLGVPLFVLDTEPILTTFSYGAVFIAVLFGSLFYLLLYQIKKFSFFRRDIMEVLIGIRKSVFMMIFIIVMSVILLNKIFSEQKEGLLYINKDYKIKKQTEYTTVYISTNNKPLIYCKTGLIEDECFENLSNK